MARYSLFHALFLAVHVAAQSVSCNSSSICFASGLGTGAVLQRGPVQAALYGSTILAGAQSGTVAVTLASVDGTYSKTFSTSTQGNGTWKVLLDAMPTGGNFSATAVCSAGCMNVTTVTINDLTFGDVWMCFGQSNMWLPLQYTTYRNVTLDAVVAGQYSNLRLWRGGLGTTPVSGNWVGPQAPLPPQGSDTTNQWRTPQQALGEDPNQPGNTWLVQYPSTCFYAFQFLTDMLGADAPPFGLVSVPVGGTTIEQWTEWGTQMTQCSNVTCLCTGNGCDVYQPLNDANCTGNAQLYNGNIQPFLNMTLTGWLYYQGENNLVYDAGNSAQKTGYGCLLPAMIAQLRSAWSVVPGTTSPNAPFGVVALAEGTDEGWGLNMGRFRWSQTANYGVLPNPAMPNTFLVAGHDGGDPWDDGNCANLGCCVDESTPLGPQCNGDHRGQWSKNGTSWFMGCIHPRTKETVGARLAQGMYTSTYNGSGITTGPVFTGCLQQGNTITLVFDPALLANESVVVSRGASLALENTALYVLLNATLPADTGDNHHSSSSSYGGPYANGDEFGVTGWLPVVPSQGRLPNEVTVDLSHLPSNNVTAIRYATGTGGGSRMCCGPLVDVTFEPCAPSACPIKATGMGTLPALPFVANIVNNKCACFAPQVCDATPASQA